MPNDKQFQILLLEDSPTAAKMASHWLADGLRMPYRLHQATELTGALEFLRQGFVDLAIIDLNLPDSSGLDTFREIYAHSKHVPIVILSGDTDEELAIEAVRLGAQDYVLKNNGEKNPLARPVRFAWERVRRHRAEVALHENKRQLFVARALQEHLLPDAPPVLEGIDIACRCELAEIIGGDYFDFIPLPDNTWGLVIADVSGHGMAAALMSVEVRAVLRALARNFSSLIDILEVTNELITPDLDEQFVTLFFARFNPAARTLEYGSAAHPALLIYADGRVQKLDSLTAPLGIHEGEIETSEGIVLSDGDLLVLYTDGIVERFNPRNKLFGTARLVDSLREHRHRPAAEIIECVLRAMHDFAGDMVQVDDATLVVVKAGTARSS